MFLLPLRSLSFPLLFRSPSFRCKQRSVIQVVPIREGDYLQFPDMASSVSSPVDVSPNSYMDMDTLAGKNPQAFMDQLTSYGLPPGGNQAYAQMTNSPYQHSPKPGYPTNGQMQQGMSLAELSGRGMAANAPYFYTSTAQQTPGPWGTPGYPAGPIPSVGGAFMPGPGYQIPSPHRDGG